MIISPVFNLGSWEVAVDLASELCPWVLCLALDAGDI